MLKLHITHAVRHGETQSQTVTRVEFKSRGDLGTDILIAHLYTFTKKKICAYNTIHANGKLIVPILSN